MLKTKEQENTRTSCSSLPVSLQHAWHTARWLRGAGWSLLQESDCRTVKTVNITASDVLGKGTRFWPPQFSLTLRGTPSPSLSNLRSIRWGITDLLLISLPSGSSQPHWGSGQDWTHHSGWADSDTTFLFLSLPGTQPSQAGQARLLPPLTSCAVTRLPEDKAATFSQLAWGVVGQVFLAYGWGGRWLPSLPHCPGLPSHGGLEAGSSPWTSQAELPVHPTHQSSLALGEMLGMHLEIRELLLCFPFGFYPYVQDSLVRKAGRQGGEP